MAQPVEVPAHSDDAYKINALRELGVLGCDPADGTLVAFEEKPTDPDDPTKVNFGRILDICAKTGSNLVFKNTFFMAVSARMQPLMLEAYGTISEASGKPLLATYRLDWSKHFIEPSTMTLEAWMQKFDPVVSAADGGVPNKEDWAKLYKIAQYLKAEANGIGVCDIGERAFWSDVGTIKELAEKYLDLVSDTNQASTREKRNILRDICGVKRDLIIEGTTGLSLADIRNTTRSPERTLVINSTFKNGGKVSEGCIVIGSTFEEYVELPPNTIVVGSHIYSLGQIDENGIKFLYMFNPGKESVTNLTADTAYATTYDHDGTPIHLKSPIGSDIKGKPVEYAFPQASGETVFGKITDSAIKSSISATYCNSPIILE